MDNRQTSSTHNHRTTVHTTWYKTTFHSPGTKVPHLSRARRCRRCTSRRGARSALQPFHPLPHSRVLFLALPVCVALSVAIARELSGKAIQLYQRVRHFHPDAHRSSVGGGTLRCARSPPPSPPRATVRPCLCHSLVPCPCVPGSSGGASSIADLPRRLCGMRKGLGGRGRVRREGGRKVGGPRRRPQNACLTACSLLSPSLP